MRDEQEFPELREISDQLRHLLMDHDRLKAINANQAQIIHDGIERERDLRRRLAEAGVSD